MASLRLRMVRYKKHTCPLIHRLGDLRLYSNKFCHRKWMEHLLTYVLIVNSEQYASR